MSYRSYIDGYTRSAVGGRAPAQGVLTRVLLRVVGGRRSAVALALGVQDGVTDRELRSRVEVEAEIERLLA